MKVADLHSVADRAAALLKALAHDRRLMIVCELTAGERTVGELERVVGLSQSALSQHLARLRRDGIVTTRRKSQHIYYALSNGGAAQVVETLAGLYCAESRADIEAARLQNRESPPRGATTSKGG